MIEARHLRVLRAVERQGSFSAAARELGLTQPAISQQMKALERSLGTPLVVRVGRGVALSEAGRVLAEHAAGVLAGLAAAEDAVAGIAGLRTGRVRLVSFPTASATLVPAAVAALRVEAPGVQVSLTEAEPPASVGMLRAVECELVLAFRYPSAEPEDWSDLAVTRLRRDPLVALLPADHPLAGEPELGDLAALQADPWIAGCPQCRGHLVDLCEAAGFTPRIDFATDDYPAVLGLVAAGLGVAVLPRLALAATRTDGVAVVPLAAEVAREIVALTLPDLGRVPAVALMVEKLKGL
ncbi:LysR family transcriptional regulator [Streptacidiphilus jiangxiensis]|uniref:ModE molybdate transport repressor domain-containing protein n=1 Tax=Streptacidiphilus jiangxiensis TaxID=235985 RepID=A0A1H7M8R3_STRJI|nr:LysR family transcriptional regulator [Streptacidiphilus jiangxiensis]SEL07522.1 ModE molybdate transport repressor domain-containing protein [Streptacidiphilus jiangxiensis]